MSWKLDPARHPSKVGKYVVERIVGEGAMGVVYQGYDPDIERTVAIKTLHAHLASAEERLDWLGRFAREAKAAGRVIHRNLVTVFDYLEIGDQPFLVMEFIDAPTVGDLMQGGAMPHRQVVRLMDQLFEGIEHIHAAGIIHRDIKPENVMVLGGGQVKLTDFGVARFNALSATQSGIIGTPHYMSPEQLLGGDIDHRADVYACGILLYELLAGRRPFEGSSIPELFRDARSRDCPKLTELVDGLPEILDGIIDLALAPERSDRFDDIRAFRKSLLRSVGKSLKSSPDEDSEHDLAPTVYAPRPKTSESRRTGTRFSSVPEPLVERLTPVLARHIGPIASVLARRTAEESSSFDDLVDRLANGLGTGDQAAFRAEAREIGGLRVEAGDAGLIDTETEERLVNYLAMDLGPVARIVVKRATAASKTREELCRALVAELNDGKYAKWIRSALGIRHG